MTDEQKDFLYDSDLNKETESNKKDNDTSFDASTQYYQQYYNEPVQNDYNGQDDNYINSQSYANKDSAGFFDGISNKLLSIKKSFSNLTNGEKLKFASNIFAFICALIIIIISFSSFFAPLLHYYERGPYSIIDGNITPLDFLENFQPEAIWAPDDNVFVVSFWVYKIFFTLSIVIWGIALISFLFNLFARNKKAFSKKLLNILLGSVVIMLFLSVLAARNYQTLFQTVESDLRFDVRGFSSFIFAFILLIIRALLVMPKYEENILDRSDKSIATPFALIGAIVGGFFMPLYIQSGTNVRITGFRLLTDAHNPLSFLEITKPYKSMIFFFLIVSALLFLACLILYITKRKVFVYINKFNTFVGLTILITYALMGGNYMLTYFDAGAYNSVFAITMNTYSYVPLVMFVCFIMASYFIRLATAKLKVDYKIYASSNGSLVSGASGQTDSDESNFDPIPAFSEIELKQNEYEKIYKEKSKNAFKDITLPKLVNHIIEYAMYSKEKLSYGDIEIKTFIAGLGASKLSILQGMSGTGKTSLPRIFMEAINGNNELIAVESSWRDKNELIGYYNEFNKKFTPKDFTQALYRASFNKNTPTFIVLDELNLSRIEYYFSDFLSILELKENERFIKLFDVRLYPQNGIRSEYKNLVDGNTLEIPPNVWFIGTANRDESTFEISDKVYDRAQTLNFDKRSPKINTINQVDYPQKFVSYKVLEKLFDEAKLMEFNAEKCQQLVQAEQVLAPYRISFGNRILKQIEDFVKVYVACSPINKSFERDKYIAEAIDCIVLSKIVKKLEFRQINEIDSLIDKFSDLNMPKCYEFLLSLQPNL